MDDYRYFRDLSREVNPPDQGILSRTLHNDDWIKVVAFGFAAGEELAEHTASMPAMLQFISGHGTLALGKQSQKFASGTFVYMPARLLHAVSAEAPTVMLLILVKQPQSVQEAP